MLRYFLGIEIYQNKNNLFISQKNYVDKILKKFNVATPVLVGEMLKKEDIGKKIDVSFCRSLIGNLLYLTTIRPDIMFATRILTIFMNTSSHIHFRVTKRILIYLQGTKVFEIKFDKQEDLKLIEFCDSD